VAGQVVQPVKTGGDCRWKAIVADEAGPQGTADAIARPWADNDLSAMRRIRMSDRFHAVLNVRTSDSFHRGGV